MAERTTSTHDFGIEPVRAVPVARINPVELVKTIGAIIRLDARASTSDDGSELSYSWSLISTPLGSQVVEIQDVGEDSSVVSFTPDITGQYVVGLVVSTPYRDSEPATSTVLIQAILAPALAQLTPDASWIWHTISDFWSLVENRGVFESLWSGKLQVAAAEMLRMYQVDYAKSIKDIQPLFQRRWLDYSTRLDFGEGSLYAVIGYEQSGTGAFTGSINDIGDGLIVSGREFILLSGTVANSAVGTDLRVFTSKESPGNVGTYTINRVNSDGTGYLVSVSTPFPSPASEVVVQGTDLVTFQLGSEVRTGTNMVLAGVVAGDYLWITAGSDSGFYEVAKVGTPDGLANDDYLELVSPMSATRTNVSYKILRSVRASFQKAEKANTSTVYIPESEADLDTYQEVSFSGSGTVEGAYEILVESRHIFDSLAGQSIRILSGRNAGRSFSIAAVNPSRTGYIVGASFGGPFPQAADYAIPTVADISSRVLILEDRAYEIVSARLDPTSITRGPVWVISLKGEYAPSGRENLPWRIANSLINEDASVEYEELGVVADDLLIFSVERTDNSKKAILPCTVLGAVANKIAFTVGSEMPESGVSGEFSDQEIFDLALDLEIPRVDSDSITGGLIYTLSAEEIQVYLNSSSFRTDYYNLPISEETAINLELTSIRITPQWVVRNSRIPLDETVISIPSLFEYIKKPLVGEDADGNIILVGTDGTEKVLPDVPYILLENKDYTVSDDAQIVGDSAVTAADSDIITVVRGDLRDRDVKVNDTIDLESGFDQGRYVILEVRDDEQIRVLGETGDLPITDATGLKYTINRRTPGKFLRFIEGMFTSSAPAPHRFWAETTFFDNDPYIEDNFGVLVGVTKAELDEYGSSQVTYKGAVSGLMYSWTMGPSVANVAIGAHLLLGLPVTEVPGEVIDIDDNYAPGVGRIMIEDLDADGEKTGLVRIYFYTPISAGTSLPKYSGLSLNPTTGSIWQLDDFVPPFTPLSNGVIIEDYLINPTWWLTGDAAPGAELRKYHTWQAQIDVRQVDSRDATLVAEFLSLIRPVYTEPEVVTVLYLLDEVTVEDDLLLSGELYLFDDPAFSLQMTHMVDDFNSSLPLRKLDVGGISTRTFFKGTDLVISAGSGTVTSARGGFVDGGPLPFINDHFQDVTQVGGSPAVRPGDVLYLPNGPNSGRFEVDSVFDDGTLVVIEDVTGLPPRSFDPVEFVAEVGVVFYIERLDQNPLVEGSLDTTAASNVVVDTTASFKWDDVAVDDVLILEDGADQGAYRIERVGIMYLGDNIDTATKLMLDRPMTATATAAYRIEREALRTNPLFSGQGSTTGQRFLVTSIFFTDIFEMYRLQRGDILRVLNKSDEGKEFTVIDAYSKSIYVDQPFSPDTNVSIEVIRPYLEESHPDSDYVFERLFAHDTVEISIIHPRSVFLGLLYDVTLAKSVATSLGSDFQALGVTTDMVFEIPVPDDATPETPPPDSTTPPEFSSAGLYGILQVSGKTITIGWTENGTPVEQDFPVDETPVWCSILQDVADFQVSGATVTSAATHDYEAFGVRPGDILILSAGEFVVMTVSTSTITLTKSTGLTSNETGRVVRRSLP